MKASKTKRDTTLNFRVTKQFKKEFKQLALDLDVSMVELLEKAFYELKERNE